MGNRLSLAGTAQAWHNNAPGANRRQTRTSVRFSGFSPRTAPMFSERRSALDGRWLRTHPVLPLHFSLYRLPAGKALWLRIRISTVIPSWRPGWRYQRRRLSGLHGKARGGPSSKRLAFRGESCILPAREGGDAAGQRRMPAVLDQGLPRISGKTKSARGKPQPCQMGL